MKKITLLAVIILVCVSLFISLSFSGCQTATPEATTAAETEAAGEKVVIGYSMPFIEDSPYCFPFSQALRKAAESRGWEIILTDAKGDINTQVNQVESLVEQQIDGLLVMPTDAAGIVSVLEKVRAENPDLPILISNTQTDPPEIDAVTGFAGPDSYLEGKQMGEEYIKYVEAQGMDVINYCHLTGMAGYGAAIDRTRGFDDALKEAGVEDKFNLLDLQPGDWSPDKGQTLTENWLTTFGDELQMIYSHNDGMGIGVIAALKAAGLEPGKIVTNGCDGQTQAVQLVKDGWMLFTIWQSPMDDGELSMVTMEKILKGEQVDYFTYLITPTVDASNAEEYLPKAVEIWGAEY
jgi:ABC-type sugar transport system substrate-binding protein